MTVPQVLIIYSLIGLPLIVLRLVKIRQKHHGFGAFLFALAFIYGSGAMIVLGLKLLWEWLK